MLRSVLRAGRGPPRLCRAPPLAAFSLGTPRPDASSGREHAHADARPGARPAPGEAQPDSAGAHAGSGESASPSGGAAAKPPWVPVAILTGAQLMLNLGMSQVVPVLPYFAQETGELGASGLGIVLALPSAARLLVNIPLGRLADTVGRRPLMIVGTMLSALGVVGTGLAMPYGLLALLPFRALVGFGSGCSMVGSGAMIADLSDRAPEHRAKLMGIQQAVVSSAWALGPAVGGVVAEQYGALNSFYLAGAGTLMCTLGYMALPETLTVKPHATHKEPAPHAQPQPAARSAAAAGSPAARVAAATDAAAASATALAAAPAAGANGRVETLLAWWRASTWRKILASADQRLIIAISACTAISQSCFMAVIPFHLAAWGVGPASLGAVFAAVSAVYMVSMPVGSWLADRLGNKRWLSAGGMLGSHLSFGALACVDSYSAFLGVLTLSNVAAGLATPAVGALTAQVTPQSIRGRALSVHRTAADVLGLVCPVGLGVLADVASCEAAIGLSAAAMAGLTAWTGLDSIRCRSRRAAAAKAAAAASAAAAPRGAGSAARASPPAAPPPPAPPRPRAPQRSEPAATPPPLAASSAAAPPPPARAAGRPDGGVDGGASPPSSCADWSPPAGPSPTGRSATAPGDDRRSGSWLQLRRRR